MPCRCTFESGFYLVNGNGWRENNVTAQLSEWILLNSQVPLYIGAVKAPLMALFYDRYDNIESACADDCNHLKRRHIALVLVQEADFVALCIRCARLSFSLSSYFDAHH